MAVRWGGAWGASWGNAWGTVESEPPAPSPAPASAGGGGGGYGMQVYAPDLMGEEIENGNRIAVATVAALVACGVLQ